MKKIWNILILLAVVLAGCNNTDGLWDEVHDLQSRLAKLEKQTINLNGNITALQSLYKDGISITKVEEGDGTYTLTLSNGETLKVVQKMEETAYPVVGIDAEGYWTVSYGSSAPTRILVSGNPVKALGEDGLTPQFRVNSTTGYWEVRYKESEAYQEVKDTNGNPVVADGNSGQGSDRFFESVGKSADGKSFNMKLKDGTELSIPITTFSCTFEPSVTGVQRIDSKATQTFKVLLNNVDDITLMAVPAGWTAELSAPVANEATLTVTAPETFADATTRATANNTKEISLLATTSLGLSTILKLQVEVIPQSRVVDYKALYDAGTDITVGDGIVVNKATFTKVISSTDVDFPTDGNITNLIKNAVDYTVIFLDKKDTSYTLGAVSVTKNIAIMGTKSDAQPTVAVSGTTTLGTGSLLLNNIAFELSLASQLYSVGANAFSTLAYNKCSINNVISNFTYFNNANGSINTISIVDTHIKCKQATAGVDWKFININAGKRDLYKVFTLKNSIISSSNIIKSVLWTEGNAAAIAFDRIMTIENNTFVNLVYGTIVYLTIDQVQTLTVKKNIFYIDKPATGITASYLYSLNNPNYAVTDANKLTDPVLDVDDNLVYDKSGTMTAWNKVHSNSKFKPTYSGDVTNAFTPSVESPFSTFDMDNRIFVSKIEGYGANLK